ncbi:MAG: MFS transporter [Holophagales bacterium]|jgi:PAT family beta-lactamase induction signal transducer AmpG|nr:MFS transporter [Holophagales bacterium]
MNTTPLRAFGIRGWVALALLGFSSGLPLALTDSTLKAWLREAGLDLKTIGFFALVGLPYNLKFLWAPLVDRYSLPFLGRRRGWMLVTQFLLAGAMFWMSLGDPKGDLAWIAALALGVAFLSASQDIVADAWRTERLPKAHQGTGVALWIGAYRAALLAAGAGALIIAHQYGWKAAYQLMALLAFVGTVGTFIAEEPTDIRPPKTLKEAVVAPWRDFLTRSGALYALGFIVLYKLGDQLATSLTVPFLIDCGYAKDVIGAITKGVGLPALIVGGLAGGFLMQNWPLKRSLYVFGFIQIFAVLSLLLPATLAKHNALLSLVIAMENLGFGMGTSAYVALIMRLCNQAYTGTQFSLLTSVAALPRTLIASVVGDAATFYGWAGFFLMCAAAALPGILLLGLWKRWGPKET